MNVWGYLGFKGDRIVVLARSRKAAAEAMGVSDHVLKTYGAKTSNQAEIAAAYMAGEGVTLHRPGLRGGNEFWICSGWWYGDPMPWDVGVEPDFVYEEEGAK